MKKLIFLIFCWTAALSGHPVVVGIFGGENCPWSKQLCEEVWNCSTFQAVLSSADMGIEERKGLEQETPVLILVSSEGKEIGRLGFLMISPEKYADLFKEMVSIYELDLSALNVSQLLHFYQKCQVLNMKEHEAKILERGVAIDTGVDFLIEKYAKLCKSHPRKAYKLKSEIRKRKPATPAVEWQLALLRFHARNEKGNDPRESAKPLEKYLRHYGNQDPDNRWRCHLILAQFFQEKNRLDKARHHATLARQEAPDELKGLIPNE